MKTKKPISTISYNSEKFLTNVLNSLVKKHIICFYMFIKHTGEIDSVTGLVEKDHIHLYVLPNRSVDTMDLSEYFIEEVEGSLPLKTISWCNSKSDDFILYCMHDENYLMSKFESRQFQYTFDDFFSSDIDEFSRLFKCAFNSSTYAQNLNRIRYFQSGGNIYQLMQQGLINPQMAAYYQNFQELYDKSVQLAKCVDSGGKIC